MSQIDALRDMDAVLHAAFADAGMSGVGTYSEPGAPSIYAVPVRVYVDKGAQTVGAQGSRVASYVTVTLLRADVAAPVARATVTVDGERWRLVSPTENCDDGISTWNVEAANV